MTGHGLNRIEPDGSMVPHADMSAVGVDDFNEIVVDGRGNVYVNGGVDFHPEEGTAPGIIALVAPDGSARRVAEDIAFPNGMVVTPDNSTLIIAESFARRLTAFDIADDGSLSGRRVWADGVGPDGICMDADGAIWVDVGEFGDNLARPGVEGGEVLDRSARPGLLRRHARRREPRDAVHARGRLAHVGGLRGEHRAADQGPRTGKVLAAPAPAPGVGWP